MHWKLSVPPQSESTIPHCQQITLPRTDMALDKEGAHFSLSLSNQSQYLQTVPNPSILKVYFIQQKVGLMTNPLGSALFYLDHFHLRVVKRHWKWEKIKWDPTSIKPHFTMVMKKHLPNKMWQVLPADKANNTLHVKEKWQLKLAVENNHGRQDSDGYLSELR